MCQYIKKRKRASLYNRIRKMMRYIGDPLRSYNKLRNNVFSDLITSFRFSKLKKDLSRKFDYLTGDEKEEYLSIVKEFLLQDDMDEIEYIEYAGQLTKRCRELQKKIKVSFLYDTIIGFTWIEWGTILIVLLIISHFYPF